jgi:20S proteasome subunit alpha 6
VDKATNYSHFSRDGGHDSGNKTFGSRNGSIASSGFLSSSSCNRKKDENRRNFTDFKIVGLEIQDLSWTWGVIPASKSHIKAEPLTVVPPSSPSIGSEDTVSKATSQPAKKKPKDHPTSSINSRKDPVVRGSPHLIWQVS